MGLDIYPFSASPLSKNEVMCRFYIFSIIICAIAAGFFIYGSYRENQAMVRCAQEKINVNLETSKVQMDIIENIRKMPVSNRRKIMLKWVIDKSN